MVHNLGLLQMHLYATEWLLTTCIYAEKSVLNLHIQRFIVMSNPRLLPLLKIVRCSKFRHLTKKKLMHKIL